MKDAEETVAPSVSFALALLAVALFFLVCAKDIQRVSLAGQSDPGPRALPIALCVVLIAGAVVELVCGLWARRESAPAIMPPIETATSGGISTRGRWNAVILTGALLAYLMCISWIGFQLSTLVFATFMMKQLGARWWSAWLMAIALVIIVRVLFGGVFHVQLPAGRWNLSF